MLILIPEPLMCILMYVYKHLSGSKSLIFPFLYYPNISNVIFYDILMKIDNSLQFSIGTLKLWYIFFYIVLLYGVTWNLCMCPYFYTIWQSISNPRRDIIEAIDQTLKRQFNQV